MAHLFPSLISAPLLNLEATIKQLEPYCDGFHLDIMDNHFVDNLTFGAAMVNAIAAATSKRIWVHLMVDNPASWCSRLHLPSDSIVSFHFEATNDVLSVAECITEKKWVASLAVNPKTNVVEIFKYMNVINHVLLMSVNPGHSGQPFIQNVMTKIDPLKDHAQTINAQLILGMDGGITQENIGFITHAGVEDIALASAIFSTHDPINALKSLKRACT